MVRVTRFNIQQFYVLPTQYICVFCVDLRTNSDYFPIQWLVCTTETECSPRGTDWNFIYGLNETKVVIEGFKFHILEAELLDVLRLPDSVARTELQAGCVFQLSQNIFYVDCYILLSNFPVQVTRKWGCEFTFTLDAETSSFCLSEMGGNL